MCIIPIVFMIVALILYKKKCTLSETRLAEMVRETEARKLALAGATENTDEPVAFEEPVAEESALANDVVSPLSEIAETSRTPPLTPRTTNNRYSIRNKKRSPTRERFF